MKMYKMDTTINIVKDPSGNLSMRTCSCNKIMYFNVGDYSCQTVFLLSWTASWLLYCWILMAYLIDGTLSNEQRPCHEELDNNEIAKERGNGE